MKKKLGLVVGIIVGCLGVSQAAPVYTTVSPGGAWTDGATWDLGTVPNDFNNHDVRLNHAVSLNSAIGAYTLWIGTVGTAGKLTLNSGADLEVKYNSYLGGSTKKGALQVNSGAVVTYSGRNLVGNGSNAEGTIVVDGGRYVANHTLAHVTLGGAAGNTNSTAKLVLTNGGTFVSTSYVNFLGGNGTTATVDVHKNSSMEFVYLTATAAAGFTYSFNLNGGDLILTQAAEGTALQGNAKINFDAGTIKFTGVDSQGDYDTFVGTWNTWVDNGMITNTVGYTDAQLKGALSFNGADAIAVIPEPATMGLFIVAGAGCLIIRRKMF
jgi:hypothetical protein